MNLHIHRQRFLLLVFSFTALWVLILYFVLSNTESSRPDSPKSIEPHANSPLPLPAEIVVRFDLDAYLLSLDTLGPVNSILISQNGEMIGENYYGRMQPGRAHNVKSVSKSILSILVGIAIDQGYLDGVDQTIGEFFPEYFDGSADSIKASITIEDLMTMRSGLGSTSIRNYGRWVTSRNWILHALNRPMEGTPGVDRIYSTGNTHLLAVILTRASGMSLLQFANRYLFGPMQIRVSGWDRDPQGYFLGGNNMALQPRDLIKIGQLMMDAGNYEGEQLVSREWIIRSVEPVTGRGGENNYGYLWFRRMAGNYHQVYAFGNGGQYLIIIPELETVVSVTTWNNTGQNTRLYRRQLISSMDRELIPWLSYRYNREVLL